MTRVLFVSGTVPPDPCGVGDYTLKLASSLSSTARIETAILTGSNSSAVRRPSDVAIFPLLRSWNLREIGQTIRLLKTWKPDVVHVQFPTQGYGRGFLPYVIPLAAKILGIATVQTWHEAPARRQSLRLLLQLFAASRIVVVRANFSDLVHSWHRWAIRLSKPIFIANASVISRATCSADELLRERHLLLQGQKRLIVFFGFLYPAKGVELLFEIADPSADQIVIAGASDPTSSYFATLQEVASRPKWQGKVTFAGFISPERAALLLAACDAVILPFRQGGGHWNTSLRSAVVNGAFVITTSMNRVGYDKASNVFYTRPDDIAEMRAALEKYGKRRDRPIVEEDEVPDEWKDIAHEHCQIYQQLLACHSR